MSKNLHSMNNSGYYSNFIKMFEQYNVTGLGTESSDNDKIRRYTTEMREKYLSFWRHSLENSKKLEFYKTFKDEYSTSDYLYQLRHYDERQNFVKFKISNHKLMIEHGRYQIDHLPRENRLCPLCNSNQVEDEIHFFFQCNKYSVKRQAFINQINGIIPDFDKKSSPESIKLIMNSNEHYVKKLVMKFIFSCMKIRDPLLVM